eukprot:scaffold224196_cov32-Tisochrysis_lutea.AAC.1
MGIGRHSHRGAARTYNTVLLIGRRGAGPAIATIPIPLRDLLWHASCAHRMRQSRRCPIEARRPHGPIGIGIAAKLRAPSVDGMFIGNCMGKRYGNVGGRSIATTDDVSVATGVGMRGGS